VAIAYLVFFGSVLAFTAYIYALQHLSVEQMSIYAYMNPIVAVVLGVFLFNEQITVFMIAGGVITLYGVYMINNALRSTSSLPRHNKRPSKRYRA
jgi:drug/metabolite transporter (DMT)-like permease